MAEILIIIGVFAGIIESAIVKKYNKKYGEGGFVFTAILALFSMIFFILTDTDGFNIPGEILWYAIPAGICYALAYFFTFIAFGCGPFALSVLIMSYTLVFPTVYGLVALGESATLFTYTGLICVFISIFLFRSRKEMGDGKFSLKWLISVIIVWAGNGMISVLRIMQQKQFNDKYNNDFMVVVLIVAAVLMFGIGIIKERKNIKQVFRCGVPWGAAAGILNGCHNAISMIIITLMPVSISSPLTAGIKIVTTFVFSYIVYKESYDRRQLAGVILGIISVVLLKM